LSEGKVDDAIESIISDLADHRDYGLVEWFFLRDGQSESPFAELRNDHADVWKALVETIEGWQE
jgi:hypothetical protein